MSVGSQSVPSGVKGSLNCFFKADILKKIINYIRNLNFMLGKMNMSMLMSCNESPEVGQI